MMTPDRPVSGPVPSLLRGFGVGLDRDRRGQRPGSDLVEARAAIDRSIVARREWNDGLPPAGSADRRVELSRALVGAGALGDRSTRRAPLGVVRQPLAGKERLLARREGELLPAIA